MSVPEFYEVRVDGESCHPDDLEIVPHKRLEDGDIVLYFSLPFHNPYANVDPQVAAAVGIDHPLCRGVQGTSVLDQIRSDVGYVMETFAVTFFDYDYGLTA